MDNIIYDRAIKYLYNPIKFLKLSYSTIHLIPSIISTHILFDYQE